MKSYINLILTFCLIFTGCSTLSVKSNYDSDYDFSRIKTFGWIMTAATDLSKPGFGDPGLDAYTREVISRELAARGYQPLASGKPDFLVGYHAAVEEKFDFQSACEYSGMRFQYWEYGDAFRSCPIAARKYEKGTLVIDIIDPETETIVWRGSAQSDIYQYGGMAEQRDRISIAVRKILVRFPPER